MNPSRPTTGQAPSEPDAALKGRRYLPRIISGVAMLVVTLLILWAGLPLLAPLYLVLTLVGLHEYAQMMNKRGIPIRLRSLYVAAILTLPAALPVSYPGMIPLIEGVSWREALVGLFIVYLVSLEIANPNDNSLNAVVFTLFGYLYIPWLLGFSITLRYTPDPAMGLWYLTLPTMAVVATDVGAYTFGSLFGKRKLAPQLSPNKTVEGSLGGLALATAMVFSLLFVLDAVAGVKVKVYDGLLFSVLVSSAAQLGDLFESLLKRWVGVKDSGSFLPGHGGVLDRIDSILVAYPLTYFFFTLVVLR